MNEDLGNPPSSEMKKGTELKKPREHHQTDVFILTSKNQPVRYSHACNSYQYRPGAFCTSADIVSEYSSLKSVRHLTPEACRARTVVFLYFSYILAKTVYPLAVFRVCAWRISRILSEFGLLISCILLQCPDNHLHCYSHDVDQTTQVRVRQRSDQRWAYVSTSCSVTFSSPGDMYKDSHDV